MTGKALVDIFRQSETLTAQFGSRLFPAIATQGAAMPYAVYEIYDDEQVGTKDAADHVEEPRIRFVLVAESYAEVSEGAKAIKDAFVRVRGTYAGTSVNSATFEGVRDLFSDSDRRYSKQVDIKLRINS